MKYFWLQIHFKIQHILKSLYGYQCKQALENEIWNFYRMQSYLIQQRLCERFDDRKWLTGKARPILNINIWQQKPFNLIQLLHCNNQPSEWGVWSVWARGWPWKWMDGWSDWSERAEEGASGEERKWNRKCRREGGGVGGGGRGGGRWRQSSRVPFSFSSSSFLCIFLPVIP